MSSDPKEKSTDEPAEAGPSTPKGPLILALFNTMAIVAAAGLLGYSKFVFKRPAITEATERARLEKIKAMPKPVPIPAYINFDSMTINIASPAQGKSHFLTVTFTMEIRDGERKDAVEDLKPILIDKYLSLVGRKEFHQINHPQGRIILRNQMIDAANEIIKNPPGSPLVSNLLFTQFIVQ